MPADPAIKVPGEPPGVLAAAERLATWTAGYRPLAGVPDELIGPDGRPRADWLRFLGSLAGHSQDEMAARFAATERHIRDTGVSYRAYGEAGERAWQIGRLPLLLAESEWRDIAAGVAQRAALVEAVLRDIYGPAELIRDGALPASVVTGSADYVRAMHGVAPPGGRYMHLYAVDLGRGPDGRWWVLGDRAQAPSGAGYALENRLVLSRALPGLYREMNVERLASFFRDFRKGMSEAAERAEPRICLLTPGAYSETYFEQAYLARYLGFLLVEGDDLTMRDGRIHVRTIAGLKRADVVWRRVDADFLDPLELNSASRLGVPGILEAMRAGGVVVANAPGSGVVESRALLGFLPALARRLLGEELRLPNIATWWCGQPAERATVLDRLDTLAIAGAFGNAAAAGSGSDRPVLPAELPAAERDRLVAAIRERPVDFVGQEIARLSTMPVLQDGRLVPRPFVLRAYACATAEGWRVMPGGFCRVAEAPDARAVSMGAGVNSADVWVLAEKPVEATTLLPSTDNVRIRRILGTLPSRAADNLFWLGRYLERAEATLRLVRSLCSSVLEADPASQGGDGKPRERLRRLLVAWGAIAADDADLPTALFAEAVLHDGDCYGAALALIRSARQAAAAIRERLSAETWSVLGRLEAAIAAPPGDKPSESAALETADACLQLLAALAGLAEENMNRTGGWRFLDMGRRIERGIATCRYARQFADGEVTVDDLNVLIDLVDSQISYRARYLTGFAFAPVLDMAVLDPFNPRSVAYQVERLGAHLAELPSLREDGLLEAPQRLAVGLAADIATGDAAKLDSTAILAFEQTLMKLADAISARYSLHGAHAARADRARGLA